MGFLNPDSGQSDLPGLIAKELFKTYLASGKEAPDEEMLPLVVETWRQTLADYPIWAIRRAFDDYRKREIYNISVGGVASLAEQHLSPVRKQLDIRARRVGSSGGLPDAKMLASPDQRANSEGVLAASGLSAETRKAILDSSRMTTSIKDAEEAKGRKQPPVKESHWFWKNRDDPHYEKDLAALKRAREENPLMRAAMGLDE